MRWGFIYSDDRGQSSEDSRVGCAHQTSLNSSVKGGQSPPYTNIAAITGELQRQQATSCYPCTDRG